MSPDQGVERDANSGTGRAEGSGSMTEKSREQQHRAFPRMEPALGRLARALEEILRPAEPDPAGAAGILGADRLGHLRIIDAADPGGRMEMRQLMAALVEHGRPAHQREARGLGAAERMVGLAREMTPV